MINRIKDKYLSDREKIENWKQDNRDELIKLKNGIYAFYKNNELLYIGMVSSAPTASLYARLYANGNAKHSSKKWFCDINEVFFYELKDAEKFDIQVLERILIRELKPVHNDLEFDEQEIKSVLDKM